MMRYYIEVKTRADQNTWRVLPDATGLPMLALESEAAVMRLYLETITREIYAGVRVVRLGPGTEA